MIGEIGCATVGGNKAHWIADMDKQLRGPFRKFSGIVWFEAAKEADWRMVSSATPYKWRAPSGAKIIIGAANRNDNFKSGRQEKRK